MEQAPLETFLPDTGDIRAALFGSALLALAALGFCVYLLLKPSTGQARNYRMLGAMLLFFVFLIAASTGFFSWISQARTGPVSIYPDAIEIAQGRIPFQDIRNAKLDMTGKPSLFDPGQLRGAKRVLFIEKMDGKGFALSEEHYPVDDILRSLRSAVKAWEASGKR